MQDSKTSPTIVAVKSLVSDLLGSENSGHGTDHINRVLDLSLKFAATENTDPTLVALVALLHDVDDYKLFGEDSAKNLTNAKKIMQECHIEPEVQAQVERSIHEIGYSKRLEGKIPVTLAGKIVSDADMCDCLGAAGIIRSHAFGIEHGRPFFDRHLTPPSEVDPAFYKTHTSSTILHYFEKILRLKDLMLTEAGRKEAESRHQFTIEFLHHLFEEENTPEWLEYLKDYET